MKKTVALLLAVVLTLSLCACGSSGNKAATKFYTGKWISAPSAYYQNDELLLKKDGTCVFKFEYNGYKYSLAGTWEVIDDLTIMVYAMTNGSSEAIEGDAYLTYLYDDKGNYYDPADGYHIVSDDFASLSEMKKMLKKGDDYGTFNGYYYLELAVPGSSRSLIKEK